MGSFLKYRNIFSPTLRRSFVAIISSYLVCFVVPAFAEEPNIKARFITKFPFALLDGGMVILKATVGNFPDPLNFVLDTGCSGISLDSSTVEDLKLPSTSSSKTVKGIAQLKQARFVYNQTFHLPKLSIDGFEYHINNYKFLEDTYGIKVNGVLGNSFLKKFIVKVDYDKQIIEVWKPGRSNYPKGGSLMPLQMENLPTVSANIKDQNSVESRYIFDTGTDMCLFLSDIFIADSYVLNTNKKMIEVQAEGPGGIRTMQYTSIREMRVGKYIFKNVPSLIFKDEYNVTLYPKAAGIIGSEVLYRFNLIINYGEAEIYLTPNTHFKKPFYYNYTGLRLHDINGHATVDKVIKNSPADKAGLQPGDVIFGLNNNFSNDINDLKEEILTARDSLKVSVLRNNQLKVISVIVESII